MKTVYSVSVGNVGNVHKCHNARDAKRAFREYVSQSKSGYGRASGEHVTLFADGEPIKEYFSPAADMRAELESGECATLSPHGEIRLCGKHVATVGEGCTLAQGLRALRNAMESAQFWPNLYAINERGNVDLLSTACGKVLASWV